MTVNLPKRIFAYLVDAFLITALTAAATIATHSPLAASLLNAFAFLFRDAATSHGSLGKVAAKLKVETPYDGAASRFMNSVLRNLPFGVPLLLFSFVTDPSGLAELAITACLLLIAAVELWRIHHTNGLRYGDQLAGDRVADLAPQESGGKYAGLAALVAVLLLCFNVFVSTVLFASLAQP